jgi:hypothetical protein
MIGESVGIEDELLDTTETPQNFILSGGVAVVTNLSRRPPIAAPCVLDGGAGWDYASLAGVTGHRLGTS